MARNTEKERDGKHAKLSQEHLQGTEAQKDKKHKKIRNTKKERDRKHAKLSQEHLQGTEAQKEKKHKKIRNTKKERDRKRANTLAGTSAKNRSTKS